ncbi:MAG TPA: alpha-2-macroglobulin family protein, partial [Blastocatellia bacterium]|nr:alpha-2-macroglobulin family protein [Blastocatellia bacterium]
MRYLMTFALAALLCFSTTHAQQSEYATLKAEAEKYFAESSYARAYELYLKADALELPPHEARWVDFRVADTLWRAQAGTQTADSTKYDEARRQLEILIRDSQRAEDRDRVWTEVQESLGDFWWTRNDSKNWGQAWPHYQQALDWWAGAKDIELARERYLKIVFTIARPSWVEPYYHYGYYGNYIPLEILENVLKIAKTENDRAHAHYLIAMTLRGVGGDWEQRQRVPEEFAAALKPGKATDWYDDALYHYAEWMTTYGRIVQLDNHQWRQEPDYVKALELFRRLINEYQKGETRYYDQARQQIENITKPSIALSVAHIFLPDSEIQFYLNWRNLKSIDMALYRVGLTRDVRFTRREESAGNWLQTIDLNGREKVKSWIKQTDDKGDHKPGQEAVRLDSKLPTGAYVVEAKGRGASARELILVTDTSLVLKSSRKQALVYFCNALDGSPLAEATVKLWEHSYNGREYVWRELTKYTNQDGIAVFDLSNEHYHAELFAAAAIGERQAFSNGYGQGYSRDDQPWRIYAFTDRPAYRPNETAQWKFIARRYAEGAYSTPANQVIEYEITDPRGAKVIESKATLNAFGSAWGALELTSAMPLGEYRVTFWDGGRKHGIGSAALFRLEEYKLPEFKVSVQTPEEDGRKKAFRVGEKVEVNVQADYYFGGAVANATVEVLVYQNPFYHWYHPPREYPWYYEDISPRWHGYGGRQGQVIKRETIKTDAEGRAKLTFDTPRNAQQDFEYFVEARVTDASRREITGSGAVRVTRQRYYVYPRAAHNLYRPQDKVSVALKALDANNQPVQAEGSVKLTRDYWYEIWLAPDGREVKGEELKRLRERSRVFPPPAAPGGKPWQLKFRGYEHDEILTRLVKTNADGEGEFTFTPEREGYYRVAWSSEDKGAPIKAETTVWVVTNASTEIGYRHGGLEIVVDKDTFRAGQRAPMMLTAPAPDRYVLFSIEGDDLYSYRLIRLAGTVKLIEVDIEEKHVPNIFLSAAMVSDRQIFLDTKQVIVPPTRNFLTVDVKADRDQYQPREDGTLTVTTRDHDGKPVAAEVALGLVDESVYYIQQDYAGDPRQFYYGSKRPQTVQTQSTLQQKSYAKLVETDGKQLADEREILRQSEQSGDKDFERLQLWADLQKPSAKAQVITRSGTNEFRSEYGARRDAAKEENKSIFDLSTKGREFDRLAQLKSGTAPAEQEPAVQVRSDFRSTVLWQPDVTTDANGTATVKVKFPDSLTTWKATARAATGGNQFGIADCATRTNQPLIVRLQAPRFFVVGDQVTVSAVINNNTDKAMTVTPALAGEGFIAGGVGDAIKPITVEANGEARVNWQVAPEKPGPVRLKVTARNGKYADAMERSYVAYEHGIEKFVAKSGKLRGNDVTVKLEIPRERKTETTSLTVQVAPSMAVTMLDALPYLINYPYGCTEQTMSRFLPAAITAKTLRDLGLRPEDAMNKVFGGIVGE